MPGFYFSHKSSFFEMDLTGMSPLWFLTIILGQSWYMTFLKLKFSKQQLCTYVRLSNNFGSLKIHILEKFLMLKYGTALSHKNTALKVSKC